MRISHGSSGALAGLADKHKRTVLAGRTWLQQATPVTFGLKAAGALSAVDRHRARIRELRPRVLVLQFGGASGTLAALGADGLKVAAALAGELKLGLPDVPWHAHRDRVAEVATALGLLVGTLGKIARDISLLMQTEVGEAFEPAAAGKGGSSTMPHKRNPVALRGDPRRGDSRARARLGDADRDGPGARTRARRLARRVGHAARDLHPRRGRARPAHARCSRASSSTRRGWPRTSRRRAGLILAEAVTMALGGRIGRLPAHHLVEAACRRAADGQRHLRDVLGADPEVRKHLSPADLQRLLDPANYVGLAEALVERALAGTDGHDLKERGRCLSRK